MLTKEIYIQNIEVKSGFGKNNKPWKFWKITDENAETYTDWSSQYADKIGQKVIITYEEKQGAPKRDGGFFVNREIVAKASPQTIEKLRAGAKREDAIDTSRLDKAYADERAGVVIRANEGIAQPIIASTTDERTWRQPLPAEVKETLELLKEIKVLVKEIHGQIINPL